MAVKASRELYKRLRKATAAARTQLAAVADGDMGAVHAARKEIKRLRGLIGLLRAVTGRRRIAAHDGALRAAARTLAGIRHQQAMGEAVDKIAASLGESAGAAVRTALAAAGAAPAGDDPPPPEPALVEEGLAALARLEEAVRGLAPRRSSDRAVIEAIAGSYRRARRRFLTGLATPGDAALHEARKAAIRLLHQLAVVERVWPQQVELWSHALAELREQLGDINDLAELRDRLASLPQPADAATIEALARRREELLAAARRCGRRVLADRPKAFRRRLEAWLATRR